MAEIELYRRRKQLFYNWLRVSLISLIALRISGLWLLTPSHGDGCNWGNFDLSCLCMANFESRY